MALGSRQRSPEVKRVSKVDREHGVGKNHRARSQNHKSNLVEILLRKGKANTKLKRKTARALSVLIFKLQEPPFSPSPCDGCNFSMYGAHYLSLPQCNIPVKCKLYDWWRLLFRSTCITCSYYWLSPQSTNSNRKSKNRAVSFSFEFQSSIQWSSMENTTQALVGY